MAPGHLGMKMELLKKNQVAMLITNWIKNGLSGQIMVKKLKKPAMKMVKRMVLTKYGIQIILK